MSNYNKEKYTRLVEGIKGLLYSGDPNLNKVEVIVPFELLLEKIDNLKVIPTKGYVDTEQAEKTKKVLACKSLIDLGQLILDFNHNIYILDGTRISKETLSSICSEISEPHNLDMLPKTYCIRPQAKKLLARRSK